MSNKCGRFSSEIIGAEWIINDKYDVRETADEMVT
jgi:hypothetical protein